MMIELSFNVDTCIYRIGQSVHTSLQIRVLCIPHKYFNYTSLEL